STTAKRMRPSAPPSDLPPNTRPSKAVMARGTMRLMSQGRGLRQARRRSLARSTRSILFPQIPPRELEKHVIQTRPLERDIFHAHRQAEQILQAPGWIARTDGRDNQLFFSFLDHPEALVKSVPFVRGIIFEVRLEHEQAVAAEAVLQFAESSLRQQAALINDADALAKRFRLFEIMRGIKNGRAGGAQVADEFQDVQPRLR